MNVDAGAAHTQRSVFQQAWVHHGVDVLVAVGVGQAKHMFHRVQHQLIQRGGFRGQLQRQQRVFRRVDAMSGEQDKGTASEFRALPQSELGFKAGEVQAQGAHGGPPGGTGRIERMF